MQKHLPELKNASIVFQYTSDSVNNFYRVYQESRIGSKGSTTHEQQDLLRAMLVFACSGLDSVVKQLIKDSLPKVIERDLRNEGARKEFQKFVERRIKKVDVDNEESRLPQTDARFISCIFSSNKYKSDIWIFLFIQITKFLYILISKSCTNNNIRGTFFNLVFYFEIIK